MRILYSSDTHVFPAHLNRLLKAAEALGPGAVILGGDLIPDWKGSIAASIQAHKLWVQEKLLPRLEKFNDEFPHIPVLLDLGNDDIAAVRPLMEERNGTILHLLHMNVVRIAEGLVVAGYMKVNPTPFSIKDHEKPDCRDRYGLNDPGVAQAGFTTVSGVDRPHVLRPTDGTMEEDLERLSDLLDRDPWRNDPVVFVSHCPPRDTALDRTGTGINVGSLAVRRFIERWSSKGRLRVSLHGHIHESPWKSGRAWQFVGNVPCFNVGQLPKVLRALLLETEDVVQSARVVRVDGLGEIRVMEKEEWLG